MDALKVIVLAAGKGTRMKSHISKVCHQVGGLALIQHSLRTAAKLSPIEIVVVLSNHSTEIIDEIEKLRQILSCKITICEQKEPLGTGHAVLAAQNTFENFLGNILILFADTPLITQDTLSSLQRLQETHRHVTVVLGMELEDPGHYGRVIVSEKDGSVEKVVEYSDATEEERCTHICNSGVMLLNGQYAKTLLSKLDNANAKGEYYLTDVVAHAKQLNLSAGLVIGDEQELLGVNSRTDLAYVEYVFQSRMREQAMENGVTLIDPESVYFSYDTQIANDVIISPNVTFGLGVKIESQVLIKPYCHIEGAIIKSGAQIGPFAHIRPGSNIGESVKIGNFVEIKKSTLEAGAKVNHLSYIGDAEVGKGANIGAGTITCNYDGYKKHQTKIGKNAFIGSNTALVAPVEIGDRAVVGAGSVITRRLLPDALGYSRSPQQEIIGGATRYRRKRSTIKVINKQKG